MILKQEEIIEQAMTLPPESRALLADRLLHSLDSPTREEIDRLWAEEAVKEIKVPGKEILKKIKFKKLINR
jgi:hypothetical protein